MKRKPSEADILLWEQLKELPFFEIGKEVPVCPYRRWRFDFAVQDPSLGEKVAIEIEGGIWNHGAHVRGRHFESDMAKYNEAARLGWKVLRFSTQQVLKGEAIEFIKKVLET